METEGHQCRQAVAGGQQRAGAQTPELPARENTTASFPCCEKGHASLKML